MQDIQQYRAPDRLPAIITEADLHGATVLLSDLNRKLDAIKEHKEEKTRPINEALKKIREDYKPLEEQLTTTIAQVRASITQYATNQAKIALEQEQKILSDKRTTLDTKINKLANIEPTNEKVTTDQGSITFTTVKKYSISDPILPEALANLYHENILTLDVTALKDYIKTTGNTPQGITITEEKSLRNFR